jgi:hypothetical protein
MFRMMLQCWLYIEMHYIVWKIDMDAFRAYWLCRNIQGKIHDGRIILNEQIYRLPCISSVSRTESITIQFYNYSLL